MRQVEVMRDAILHALADDPTLSEDDVVVLCPALADFEPLLEAGFGPSADRRTRGDAGPPQLRYRIGDRSLTASNPLADACGALLSLVAGRCPSSEVLSFLSLDPVRRRFSLSDDDLATVAAWVKSTGTRWGLDAEHRTRWSVPAEVTANTWRSMLDQLLVGLAVDDHDFAVAPGEIAPLNTNGSIDLLGRVASVITSIAELERHVRHALGVSAWLDLTEASLDTFFSLDWDDLWQGEQLRRALIDQRAQVGGLGADGDLELDFGDFRRLLAETLAGQPGRANFFAGGVTITSLVPLRGVPHRVVGLLGFDEEALARRTTHGDDLVAQFPQVGDREARADERQALLEAVLMGQQQLVITRTGHNIRTNQPVPSAVPVAELLDSIRATVHPDDHERLSSTLEVGHPRQAFEPQNFRSGSTHPTQPWSFDSSALAGARARVRQSEPSDPSGLAAPVAQSAPSPVVASAGTAGTNPLRQPLPPLERRVIEVAELHRFLDGAPSAFAAARLGIRTPPDPQRLIDQLPAAVDNLDGWALGTTMLDIARDDGRRRNSWDRLVAARGELPPGTLGTKKLSALDDVITALMVAARERDADMPASEDHAVDLHVSSPCVTDHYRIVGMVNNCRSHDRFPGPVTVTYTTYSPKMVLSAWLDLLLLAAGNPDPRWCATIIGRDGKKAKARRLVVPGDNAEDRQTHAMTALAGLVELWAEAMTMPFPLTPKTSHFLSLGQEGKARGEWARQGADGYPKEREKGPGATIFVDTDLDELLAESTSEAGTAQVLDASNRLWQLVHDSSIDLEESLITDSSGGPAS